MNLNPSTIHEVVIDGHSLTIETFLAVGTFWRKGKRFRAGSGSDAAFP